jgi:ryanodine receptor 2
MLFTSLLYFIFLIRWYAGFMVYNAFVRLRHITSGRYLGVINNEISVIHREKADADAITFLLTPTKDDKQKSNEIESEESMGNPTIKYGETLVYIQHVKTSCWLSYSTYETKKRGVGKIEEKKAAIHSEGHMDDCFTFVHAQEEESRAALVIRKCMSIFSKFIRVMDLATATTDTAQKQQMARYWKKISLEKILKCLDDLIIFFAQPRDDCGHEERQNQLKILRNRQDLFHEEG